MVTLRTTIIILLLAALKLNSQTIITSGDVAGTWNVEGNPYIIEGDLMVTPDERLNIEPGVEILFTGPFSITVEGRLEADGDTDQYIIFSLDDTTGFASGNNPGWNGISFLGYSSTTSENSILDFCIVEYSGGTGVLCADYSNIIVSNSIIRNNKGKGIGFYDFSDATMENVQVNNNEQGGIDVVFSAPHISNFIVNDNLGHGISVTGNSWGGLYPVFENGEIFNNLAQSSGGGLYLNMDYNVFLTNVEIYSNSAQFGGGIYCGMGTVNMENMNIHSNSGDKGAAIYTGEFGHVSITKSFITDNNAVQEGGAIYLSESELNLLHVTMSNNTAGNLGGGLYYDLIFNEPGFINNTIIWGNYPEEIYVTGVSPLITYSDINGGFEGEGNIDSDPMFVDEVNGNYELSWDNYPYDDFTKSPCIDAGDPHSTFDPDGTRADVGAFYFHQSSITKVDINELEDELTVYPNPAKNSFHISGVCDVERIKVCNLSGHIVKQFNSSFSSAMNISDLGSGIYIVMVYQNNGEVTTEKLIKE